MAVMNRISNKKNWWLIIAVAVIWFANLECRALIKPDEGRYSEIPREMVASGDWTTPRLNGLKYFEKPALQYWATATAYTLFGQHNWTARLWSALTALIGIFVVWFAGKRLFGCSAGRYAALVLCSSLMYVVIGHINTLDMGVTFFMSAGLLCFLLAQRGAVPSSEQRTWMWLTWAALALSVLSKGLIGIVLPCAVLVLYTLIERDFTMWRRLHLLSGLAIFFAITAPWFIAVSIANPEFAHFFFIHEHFDRFLTKVHGRYQPWWDFIPVLLLGMLPWVVVMFDALARAWRQDIVPNSDNKLSGIKPQRFLLLWCVFIFVFFSASDSKLPSYILPIFPALALLIGARLAQIQPRALFWQILPVALLAAVALVMTPHVADFAANDMEKPLYDRYAQWALAAAIVWLSGMLLGLYLSYRGRVAATVVALSLTGLVAAQLALTGHESLAPAGSDYNIARQIEPYVKPDVPFYSIGIYEQTLPVYLNRTLTLVGFQGEMEFGLQQEPEKWIPDIDAFSAVWRKQSYALAIMNSDTYERLKQKELPMQIIANDMNRIVVKTP
jgi:4-amino-4-deoxy-L-arabinose transferase-like glycosyltransferase